jgi:hypothetical protein
MSEPRPSHQRRYLGMTSVEMSVLAIISLIGCCVLAVGAAIIFRQYPTFVPTPALTPNVAPTLSETPIPLATTTIALSPTPTVTSAPISLDAISLESLLIQSGDFSGDISAAEVGPVPFDRIPSTDNAISKQFQVKNSKGSFGLQVTILLYESLSSKELAYGIVVNSLGEETQPISDVGERAVVGWKSVELIGDWVELVFVRCHAVVHVRMLFTVEVDDILLYSKKLDSRLAQVVCE